MRFTNNQFALLATLFIIISISCNSLIFNLPSMSIITGEFAATGNVNLCVNHAPVIDMTCGTSATVGTPYTCDVDATDYDNIVTAGIQSSTFSDGTSIFNINSATGVIQFTPVVGNVGAHTITIGVQDNSSCTNSDDSAILSLTVAAGVVCGDGTCDATESCSTCPADCGTCPAAGPGGGGGGGGGGGEKLPPIGFDVEPDLIKVILKPGGGAERKIKIINLVKRSYTIDIRSENIGAVARLSSNSIYLEEFQESEISLNFNILRDIEPGVYNGKIIFSVDYYKKEIPIIIEIESKKVIFDVTVDIPSEYKQVSPGEDIVADIDIFNLERIKNLDVLLIYQIKSSGGDIVVEYKEPLTMKEEHYSTIAKLKLPEDVPPGKHVFAAIVKFQESIGTSTDTFEIVSKELPAPPKDNTWLLILIIVILVLIFIFLVYEHKKLKEKVHEKKILIIKKEEIRDKRIKEKKSNEREIKEEKERRKREKLSRRRKTISWFLHSLGLKKTEKEIEEIRRRKEEGKRRIEEERRKWNS